MAESFAAQIIAYHQASKHHYRTYAPGPGYLDWATQPNPFRRYTGAQVIPLARPAPDDDLPYEAGFMPGLAPVAPLDADGVSRLFFDTLAISAWKAAGDDRWALRVNPSSGNLHPSEGYLISGALPGLSDAPLVAHYAPAEHSLEVRARLTPHIWQALREGVVLNRGDGLPEETIFVGLTSILWREAWKYGDRAFRYCQHDVGHALGALGIAAAGLGWQTRLLDDLGAGQLEMLLGVTDPRGAEPEHPDCLVAVFPQRAHFQQWKLPDVLLDFFRPIAWQGQPNVLSPSRVEWRWAEAAAEIVRKPAGQGTGVREQGSGDREQGTGDRDQGTGVREQGTGDRDQGTGVREQGTGDRDQGTGVREQGTGDRSRETSASLRRIIHQRRSAREMDGQTVMERDALYRMLLRTMPRPGAAPFALLPWPPRVHLAIFVHRVTGLTPGLYLLARDPAQTDALRSVLKPEFAWETVNDCPTELPFFRLARGDTHGIASRISCGQDIAADGCFSLGMLAEFERPLAEHGAWVYPRLFWECGMIGQVLYLEAEAAGLRGTGIGCFFDDAMHNLLGLKDRRYQSLYHFTVGGPLEDERLTTLPAYT